MFLASDLLSFENHLEKGWGVYPMDSIIPALDVGQTQSRAEHEPYS